MKWAKLGRIFYTEQNHEWMVSYCSHPTIEALGGGYFRVYFSCFDSYHRWNISFFEFDVHHPQSILRISDKPILTPGTPGMFDDGGVSVGCITIVNKVKYLFFVGWNYAVSVPWRTSIGLAITDSDEPYDFVKFSNAPILDRSHVDPYSISSPWVIREGEIWRMWYGSNMNWGAQESEMSHVIKYAEGSNSANWKRKGDVCISLQQNEFEITKPTVIRDSGYYRMWYSKRENIGSYRIGYAYSKHGLSWIREDNNAGINVSDYGWDSEMIEYPCVFDHDGERYMLYNGNEFGRSGIGLAILETEGRS